MSNKANALIHESSPYLLQHAHNPVNWIPWSDDLFERAENENKPILFSIGYSSCHWCHVMEHESFEDEEVAKIMNEHFICVKIDREERPDIDQAYMDAVVLLTQRGGWPLNCFTLPDGRPIYGGTYFPKTQWKQALEAVHREFTTNLDELESFAENLTKGIIQKNSIGVNPLPTAFNNDILEVMSTRWKRMFDKVDGGLDHAPKFPMPNNYQFMLKEGWMNHDNELVNHSIFTLKKMQQGGIYDQVEGGFSRYSVDGYWRVPHFEKMLYDNAQLIEVYTEAYQVEENEEFRSTILDTIAFCKNDLSNNEGLYYSALDADSDGAEGAYYTYSLEEFEAAAGENKDLMKTYFRVDQEGYWEDGRNILLRKQSKADFCAAQGLSRDEFEPKLQALLSELRALRSNRSKPGLDHKALVSWNSMMISALCKASEALGDDNILNDALQTGELIAELVHSENKLLHSFGNDKGQGRVEAYLEDYAFAIRAFVDLFKASADPKHLDMAKRLCDQTIEQFYSEQKEMFYFTSDHSKTALHRRLDTEDGVIPSSNSAMANNLIDLNHLLNEDRYYDIAKRMLHRIEPKMTEYPPNYSNWAQAYQKLVYPFYEVAIVGPEALEMKKELQKHYLPNALVVCSTTESDLPLFEHRFKEGETRIFVCVNQQCQQPSSSVDEALKMII